MKNFVKKLSFVLASAMVVTSLYAPANAQAAAKDGIILKGKAIKSKSIFVGGEKLNFDYKIGKLKNKGAMGKWSTSDSSVIKVDKSGVVTAVGTGKATLMYKVKKNKNVKKSATYKVSLTAFARATELTIPASDKAISLKVGDKKEVMPMLKDKVEGVKTTYNVFAISSDDKIATAEVMDGKVVVMAKAANASPATITVFAAQKNTAEEAMNNQYKVEGKFEVMVKSPLEAKQVKANKVKVVGNDFSKVATSGAFTVKDSKGNALKFKEAVALNPEKTEVTLEYGTSQIPAETYTLTYGDMTSEFKAEVAKVSRIDIVPENEAILGATKSKAYAYYKVFNQFEEEVTDKAVASDIEVSGSGVAGTKKGTIVFDNNGTAFVPGMSKVVVTVVDKTTNVHKTATLTVSNEDHATDVEFAGIWSKVERKFVTEISEADVMSNYILAFTAKNQYGVEVDYKSSLNDLSVALISITGLTVDQKPEEVELNGKKYMGYKMIGNVKNENKPDREGEVMINAIALFGAKQIQPKFNVVSMEKVAKLVVSEGPLGVYNGQENELTYTAYDTKDKVVTNWKVFSRMNKEGNLSVNAGKIRFEKTEDGKIKLIYDLTGGVLNVPPKQTVYQPIAIKTETNQFSSSLMKVKETRRPVKILGLEADTVTGVTRSHELTIPVSKVVFEDQYGNPLKLGEMKANGSHDYYLRATYAQGGNEIFTQNGTVNAGAVRHLSNTDGDNGKLLVATANSAGEKVTKDKDLTLDTKVTLQLSVDNTFEANKLLGEAKEFYILNVNLDHVRDIKVEEGALYAAKDLDKNLYRRSGLAVDNSVVEPKLTGTYLGQKIALGMNDFEIQTLDAVKKQTVEKRSYESIAEEAKKTNKTTVEEKYVVAVKNSAGLKIARTFKTSIDRRVPATIEKVKDIVLTKDQEYTWDTLKEFFTLKDQYGRVMKNKAVGGNDFEGTEWFVPEVKASVPANDDEITYTELKPYITISDYNDKILKVENNGLSTFKITNTTGQMDVVTLELVIPRTSVSFKKTLKIK